jgi:hypothetical protein
VVGSDWTRSSTLGDFEPVTVPYAAIALTLYYFDLEARPLATS